MICTCVIENHALLLLLTIRYHTVFLYHRDVSKSHQVSSKSVPDRIWESVNMILIFFQWYIFRDRRLGFKLLPTNMLIGNRIDLSAIIQHFLLYGFMLETSMYVHDNVNFTEAFQNVRSLSSKISNCLHTISFVFHLPSALFEIREGVWTSTELLVNLVTIING